MEDIGTNYIQHSFNNTKTFSGSYPETSSGVHQCGGAKKKVNKRKTKRNMKKSKKSKRNMKKSKRKTQKRRKH